MRNSPLAGVFSVLLAALNVTTPSPADPGRAVAPPLVRQVVDPFEPDDQTDRFAELFAKAYRSAVEQATAIPEFPEPSSRTVGAWSVIGAGIFVEDGQPAGFGKHRAGRIKSAHYAYDDEQEMWTLYLGSSSGGLWKQVLAGLVPVWIPISDTLVGSPSVGDFAVSSLGSSSIMIGTGDRARYPGDGFYSTPDGGVTWSRAGRYEAGGGATAPAPLTVDRITVDRFSPTRALAATNVGIWITYDFGRTWIRRTTWDATDVIQNAGDPSRWIAGRRAFGLMESTDGGLTWAPVDGDGGLAGGLLPPIDSIYLAASEAAPTYLFALVTGRAFCSWPAPDGTPCRINPDCAAFRACRNASGDPTALACMDDADCVAVSGTCATSTCVQEFPAQNLNNVYRSSDDGHTWVGIEGVDRLNGQAVHAHAIGVDPDDPNHLFVGLARPQRTTNATAAPGAVLWHRAFVVNNCDDDMDGTPDPPQTAACDLPRSHADYTSFIFVPDEVEQDSDLVVITNDGGYWLYDAAANTIQGEGNVTGLTVSQVADKHGTFTQSRVDSDLMLAGMQDLSVVSIDLDDARPLHMLGSGDGGKVITHSRDRDSILFSYGNGASSNRFASTTPPWFEFDGAWSGVDGSLGDAPFAVSMGIDNPSVGVPLAYTTKGTTMYWSPTDAPVNWKRVHTLTPASDVDDDGNDDAISRIEWIDVATQAGCRIFYLLGTWDPRVFGMTTCTGQVLGSLTPVDITPPAVNRTQSAGSVLYADHSPGQPRTIYYSSGFGDPALFVSRDAGATWKDVTGNLAADLPDAIYRELIGDPFDEDRMFLATNVGVFRTDNANAAEPTWYRYMDGMPEVVDAHGLEIAFDRSPQILRLATHGRGFWERAILDVIGGAIGPPTPGAPPLVVERADGGLIRLTWGESCAPGDTDYAVYEGTLGDFDSHIPVRCTTGGETSVDLTPPAATSTYYLVTPLAMSSLGTTEGSLGASSDGAPRSRGAQSCYPNPIIQDCP